MLEQNKENNLGQGFCNTLKTKDTARSKLCFPQVSTGYSTESSFCSFTLLLCSLADESRPVHLCHSPLQATDVYDLNDNQQVKIIEFNKMHQLQVSQRKTTPSQNMMGALHNASVKAWKLSRKHTHGERD